MSAKEILLDVAEKLPPKVTLVDAIHELGFRLAVEDGLAELERGEGVPVEEVKARIAAWAGKQSDYAAIIISFSTSSRSKTGDEFQRKSAKPERFSCD